jgi:site-specific DNA-methyltransferase (adenine-specific)
MADYTTLRLKEILARADYKALVPRPTEDEYRLLKEDVHAHGVHTPVVVNPDHVLLDGYTRHQVAEELELAELPVKVDPTRDPLSEREYVIRANLNRRHLTGTQKDKLGLALLAIERERAAERRRAGLKRGDKAPVPPNLGERDRGEAVEKAGKAVGRSPESIRKAERIEKAILEHPDWTDLKNQWNQAELGNDSTDATYRTLRTLEAEYEPLAKYGDLRPEVAARKVAPPAAPKLEDVADQVLRGDCRNELSKVPNDSVNLVVTSPPYADKRKSTYGGVSPDQYVEWFLPIADEIHRVLRPDGSFVLVMKEGTTDGERDVYVMELVLMLRRHGWRWVEEYHWCKKNAMPGKWPNRFQDRWEHVFHFTKEKRFAMYQKAVREPIGDWAKTRLKNLSTADMTRLTSGTRSGFGRNMSRWVGKELVYPSNSLHIAPEAGHKGHSAAFPEPLPAWFIRLFTKKGDTVLDPFLGSGTTAVAALNLGRHYIGVEKQPSYQKVAAHRINHARKQFAEHGTPDTYFAPVSKTRTGKSE